MKINATHHGIHLGIVQLLLQYPNFDNLAKQVIDAFQLQWLKIPQAMQTIETITEALAKFNDEVAKLASNNLLMSATVAQVMVMLNKSKESDAVAFLAQAATSVKTVTISEMEQAYQIAKKHFSDASTVLQVAHERFPLATAFL